MGRDAGSMDVATFQPVAGEREKRAQVTPQTRQEEPSADVRKQTYREKQEDLFTNNGLHTPLATSPSRIPLSSSDRLANRLLATGC